VTATEAELGSVLAESLVKQITGGDPILAKRLYADPFEYVPQFKLVLATNHKPVVRGTDHAIWRRIRLVPFSTRFWRAEENPPRGASRQDERLAEQLAAEAPGILRWTVEGCLAWQRDGLGMPPEVRQATEQYRAEMDTLAGFIAECCRMEPKEKVEPRELYDAYTRWCDQTGERPLSERQLGQALQERGYQRGFSRGRRLWRGLGLANADD
jgi:putative DNA primase/helicase